MNRPCQARCRAAAVFVAAQLAIFSLAAQTATNSSPLGKNSFAAPNLRPARSPVDFFRQLLAMPEEERENFLTNKPVEVRQRILSKAAEYEALDPDERELRLRATELRWYLEPLLREPPADRAARLAQVPADLRDLIKDRLEEWSILPPPLQDEFLENERTLAYFAQIDPRKPALTMPDAGHATLSEDEQAHWDALSENQRRQVTAQFDQFFELTPDEKQKTLNTLSDAERAQMEKTLQAFGKMPASQRAECVSAFAKFAGMDARQQAEFLKNAARWSEMSPAERKAWRDLVVNVPQWPPLPIGFVMPVPGKSNSAATANPD